MKLTGVGGPSTLDELSGVSITGAVEGQILYYDADTSNWVNSSIIHVDDVNSRIGIGTTSPDGRLHVHTATAGAVTANGDADDLVVENSGNAGLSILCPDANSGRLVFGTPTDATGSRVVWDNTNSLMYVATTKAAGQLVLQTGNGTEAVRIDSSQNVGIGTTSPDGTLHVQTASSGVVTASTIADDLVVENSTDGGISILTPDTDIGSLHFGTPTEDTGASLRWDYTNLLMRLGTNTALGVLSLRSGNGVEAVHITSSQDVGIGTATPVGYKLAIQSDGLTSQDFLRIADSGLIQQLTVKSDAGGDPYVTVYNTSGAARVELHSDGDSYLNGGNVGIGTTSPDGTLHVHTATAGAVTANAVADDLIVENSGAGGISILTPDASAGVLAFGSPTDNYGAYIQYQHSTAELTIGSHLTGGVVAINAGTGSSQAIKMDDDSTAGNTRFFLYDVDNGQLERVTVGAADSGGSGYKVLRIPN